MTVATPHAADRGFATRYSLPAGSPVALSACEFLLPGHWYRNTSSMPPGALAGNDQAQDIFIRSDRLPLPLVLMREPGGHALMILQRNPDGRTVLGDNTNRTLTDARLQYSSLGVHDPARPAPGLWYPGTEGDRSYYGGGWAYRRHPVATSVAHRYEAAIRLTRTADFATAATANWNYAFDRSPPVTRRADLARVKAISLDLLSQTWKEFPDGSAGFPFGIYIPGGRLREYAMQMGFIGQNLPGANELIRAGLLAGSPALVAKGEKMVDFWVRTSPGHQGLPKTWYDANIGYRGYQTFLRIASDGVLGALRAWQTMRAYRYVGGTPDNPDVRDKEAGILTLDAFLALHDLTEEPRWLEAARQAAAYVETWTYAWPVPVAPRDTGMDHPVGRDQTGLSLIATGHSGEDNFTAYCPFIFFRLYEKTGERHYLDVSRFLLHNTKQGMDWDPSRPLGYRYPGLQTEVGTVCAPRGHSIKSWLSWVTVNALVPMSQLEDVYGSMNVDLLGEQAFAVIQTRDRAYAAARGYGQMTNRVLGPVAPAREAWKASRYYNLLGRSLPSAP